MSLHFVVFGLFASRIRNVNAELNFLDLKGVDELIDHPGASPLFGYVALKTFLPARRFFGNYEDALSGLCWGKGDIAKILKQKKDYPLDANALWLQRLFPSQDGINFVANQLNEDIVSHFTPEVIGALLNRIAHVEDNQWKSTQGLDRLMECFPT
jgi:hypothetical protein